MSEFTATLPEAAVRHRALDGVPPLPSQFSPRGRFLYIPREAFIDAPNMPALLAHPIDVEVLHVALRTGRLMSDPSVQIEGFRRWLDHHLAKQERIAVRHMDRLVAAGRERDERLHRLRFCPLSTRRHQWRQGAGEEAMRAVHSCARCNDVAEDEVLARVGVLRSPRERL